MLPGAKAKSKKPHGAVNSWSRVWPAKRGENVSGHFPIEN